MPKHGVSPNILPLHMRHDVSFMCTNLSTFYNHTVFGFPTKSCFPFGLASRCHLQSQQTTHIGCTLKVLFLWFPAWNRPTKIEQAPFQKLKSLVWIPPLRLRYTLFGSKRPRIDPGVKYGFPCQRETTAQASTLGAP